jgi:hypothetical protein
MEILGKLFGSQSKVKIMRLFLFNPGAAFDSEDISIRAKVSPAEVRKEAAFLHKTGLIKKKSFVKEVTVKRGKKVTRKKSNRKGFVLNQSFTYLTALQNLLINVSMTSHEEIARRFKNAGRVKILIVAGIFIQDFESRVDMLVVGDNLRRKQLDQAIKGLEAELGRELRYSVFETADFQYRLGLYDKLIRDILDFPHKKIIDRIGITY